MTPMSSKLWSSAMTRSERDTFGDFLAGAQFFDCRALDPLLTERAKYDPGEYIQEMFAAEMPAERTCLELYEGWIIIVRDYRASDGIMRCLLSGNIHGKVEFFQFTVDVLGNLTPIGNFGPGFDSEQSEILKQRLDNVLRCAWFSIEAMQTRGGLCHQVEHSPTRQQKRNTSRKGMPCHRWVEIRLGRDRNTGVAIGGNTTGRTVAWHYRRGHRVNHPNPNYPKWRKGSWVGDPQAGIISHTYVLENASPNSTT